MTLKAAAPEGSRFKGCETLLVRDLALAAEVLLCSIVGIALTTPNVALNPSAVRRT